MTLFFLIEYAARLWIAPELPHMADMSPFMARLRWATSAPGLIGLLAIMPAFMLAGGYSIVGSDAASIFCVLWILKLGLHAPAFGTLARVISNERAPIASVLIVFSILLMSPRPAPTSSSAAASPQQFGTLPNAHVVGGRHPDDDRLRRRGATHGRRPHHRLGADDQRHHGAGR